MNPWQWHHHQRICMHNCTVVETYLRPDFKISKTAFFFAPRFCKWKSGNFLAAKMQEMEKSHMCEQGLPWIRIHSKRMQICNKKTFAIVGIKVHFHRAKVLANRFIWFLLITYMCFRPSVWEILYYFNVKSDLANAIAFTQCKRALGGAFNLSAI